MSTPFCAVDNCLRPGTIALTFASDGETRDCICGYHAQMAVELMGERGYMVPIEISKRPRVWTPPHAGARRRYPKIQPRDDADYEHPYGL